VSDLERLAADLSTAIDLIDCTDGERASLKDWLAYEIPFWADALTPEKAAAMMLHIVRREPL
jgi:hypothetical protein